MLAKTEQTIRFVPTKQQWNVISFSKLGETGEQNRDNFRKRSLQSFFANIPKFGVFPEKSKIAEN